MYDNSPYLIPWVCISTYSICVCVCTSSLALDTWCSLHHLIQSLKSQTLGSAPPNLQRIAESRHLCRPSPEDQSIVKNHRWASAWPRAQELETWFMAIRATTTKTAPPRIKSDKTSISESDNNTNYCVITCHKS